MSSPDFGRLFTPLFYQKINSFCAKLPVKVLINFTGENVRALPFAGSSRRSVSLLEMLIG